MKRWCAMGLVLAASALVSGCGEDEVVEQPPAPPSVEELMQPGGYAVGFRELSLTYQAAGSGAERTLPVRVWYPAIDAGEAPAEYSVAGLVTVPTSVALAAPALAADGPYPLAVYSHGSGGEGLLAYPYGELFASHGWVVVAPTHVGNGVLEGISMQFDPFPLIMLNRPHDISAVLDWLAAGPPGDPLAGQTRTDAVFMFGHSFGAYTAFAAGGIDLDVAKLKASCGQSTDCDLYDDPGIAAAFAEGFGDSRIVAIAPQSPGLVPNFAAGELAALSVPTMLQSGREDKTLLHSVNAQPSWDGLDDPGDIWVDLQKGGHLSFISICDDLDIDLVTAFQPNALEDGCGPESTPTSELVPVLAAYLLGFARQQVLDEAKWDGLLRGDPFHADILIHSHPQ